MAEDPTPPEPAPPAGNEPAPPAGLSRARRWTIRGIVTLASVVFLVSVLSIWVDRLALNTDVYVSTSDKMLQNPTVRQALSQYLVDQLYANVDVAGQIEKVLPEKAKPLAGPAAAALQPYAVKGANDLLATPAAQKLWEAANRNAHERLVLLVTEGDNGRFSSQNGAVTLNLQPLLDALEGRLGEGRLASLLPPPDPNAGQIVILQSDQLNTVQTIVRWLKNVSAFLWIVALALAALAVYLAHGERRWAVRLCGFGLVGVGIVLIVGRHVAGNYLVNSLADYPNAKLAAGSAWTIVTERLTDANRTILVVGLLTVLWAWVSGVGRRAVGLRRHMAPVGRDHQGRLWIAFAAIIALIVLWGPSLVTQQLIPMVVLTALAALGLEVLRRQSVAEFPEAAVTEWRPTMRLPKRDNTGRLQRLADLHERGALTDAEFEAAKADLLGEQKQ